MTRQRWKKYWLKLAEMSTKFSSGLMIFFIAHVFLMFFLMFRDGEGTIFAILKISSLSSDSEYCVWNPKQY